MRHFRQSVMRRVDGDRWILELSFDPIVVSILGEEQQLEQIDQLLESALLGTVRLGESISSVTCRLLQTDRPGEHQSPSL